PRRRSPGRRCRAAIHWRGSDRRPKAPPTPPDSDGSRRYGRWHRPWSPPRDQRPGTPPKGQSPPRETPPPTPRCHSPPAPAKRCPPVPPDISSSPCPRMIAGESPGIGAPAPAERPGMTVVEGGGWRRKIIVRSGSGGELVAQGEQQGVAIVAGGGPAKGEDIEQIVAPGPVVGAQALVEVAQLEAGAGAVVPGEAGVEARHVHPHPRQAVAGAPGLAGIGGLKPAAAVAAVVLAVAEVEAGDKPRARLPAEVDPEGAALVVAERAPAGMGLGAGAGGVEFETVLAQVEVLVLDPGIDGQIPPRLPGQREGQLVAVAAVQAQVVVAKIVPGMAIV